MNVYITSSQQVTLSKSLTNYFSPFLPFSNVREGRYVKAAMWPRIALFRAASPFNAICFRFADQGNTVVGIDCSSLGIEVFFKENSLDYEKHSVPEIEGFVYKVSRFVSLCTINGLNAYVLLNYIILRILKRCIAS